MVKEEKVYWQLFKNIFIISACTFGGGFVIVGMIKEKFAEKTDEETGETRDKETRKESNPRMEKPCVSSLSIEDYRSLYFHPVRSQMRTAFSINLETLQNLRNVLQDLGERVSIAAYIDNILREHLREHLELLNSAAAKQRRKTTITL